MTLLTHFDEHGHARMVDVGEKPVTQREAVAEGYIGMAHSTLLTIVEGRVGKGDVLGIARIAGIMASKRTAELIPLCHPIPISHVELRLEPDLEADRVRCQATVGTAGQTGVEMEALTAVQVALLTVYDMCKAADRGMTIESVRLLRKSGGASGIWERATTPD
jgi:cyclic pyranopterin phosphate synthase